MCCEGAKRMNNHENNGHVMAWVSFGLSLASLFLAFFLNIPLLFIVLGVICAILSIADIKSYGKSIPAMIAIVLTAAILIMSCVAWYNNTQQIIKSQQEMQAIQERIDNINSNNSNGSKQWFG